MKSSEPLFTKQSPFQPASKGKKAHYHPSRIQPLSKKEKQTILSPVRVNRQTSGPECRQLLEKWNSGFGVTDGQPVFAESWPSTSCGSSPTSTRISSDMETPELGVQQDSLLAKYIERFRHGPPQSREERQQIDSRIGEEQLPFWWMSPSSLPPSSTPTKATDKDVIQPLNDDHGPASFSPAGQCQHDRSPSPCRGSLSMLSEGEFDDREILHLQERANRLLLRDDSTLSDGSILVSSEGLGCSDYSSPVSIEEPLRRPLILSKIKSTSAKPSLDLVQPVSSQKSFVTPSSLVTPTRPEEDILFQWRLRRKIEEARECPQALQRPSLHGPTFSWQAPSQPSTSAQAHKHPQSTQLPELSTKATHLHIAAPRSGADQLQPHSASGPPPFPGPSVPQSPAIAHVPAHMHLLCDVLPCPIQSAYASRQQNISQVADDTHSRVRHKKTPIPGNSKRVLSEEPAVEHTSPPPPASSEARDGERRGNRKRTERSKDERVRKKDSERMAMTCSRKQTESRCAVKEEHAATTSHQKVPKSIIPLAEQSQQKDGKETSRERCSKDYTPPPSPVHSALGQVVSEVLFPTTGSSPAQSAPVLPGSPPGTATAPPQSSVPPCDAQSSMGVISQLLQEAEDSDEKEFEDDPLLQVLRKQRARVKEQISEVDTMLNDLDK